jgi:hypothetical protein
MNNHWMDRKNTRKDKASYCCDAFSLHIELNKTYKFVTPKRILNNLGIHAKKIYRTADMCKVLKITPDTFRARLYRGIYEDKYQRDGTGRMFTLQDIKELKR